MGFFDKLFGKKEKESLDEGLQKTKENFLSKMSKAIAGKSTVSPSCDAPSRACATGPASH